MTKRLIHRLLLTLIYIISLASVHAADIKKGNWEIKYTTTMSGMPMALQVPVKTETKCIEEDNFVPESGEDGDCSHSSRRASSDKIVWDISCKSNGMKGHGEMNFNDTTMDGQMNMDMEMMGKKMAIKIDIEGKYLSACE